MANQSADVVVAALFVSHKLYESVVVPVEQLCREWADSSTVIATELLIMKALKFRVAQPLLIDDCLETAHKWDEFVSGVSCISVRFFPKEFRQRNHSPLMNRTAQSSASTKKVAESDCCAAVAYHTLIETCQKLMYVPSTASYNATRLALATVALCISMNLR